MKRFRHVMKRPFAPGLLLLPFILLLTGCLSLLNGGGDDGGNGGGDGILAGDVVLRCTDSCAAYGQCGTLDNGSDVVLGRIEGPDVNGHNLTFPVNAPALVQATEMRTLFDDVSQTQFDQRFYLVALADGTKAGWVADWCVRPPN